MASVDDRVVNMTFNSASFISGVAAVLMSLQKLQSSLQGLKGGKALSDVDAAAKKMDLSSIADNVGKISQAFTALHTIAIGALLNIGMMAAQTGARLLKSFTLGPIAAGLETYSTKLNAIQTILANTMGESGSNIGHVTKALDELNRYSDQTIFRFEDMAKNIGLFTAAGVKIDTSVASIKGLANIAALSGASSQQAASAMYQMSQAIASGTIRLMDWNSVVNAGMGGKVFQNSLIETAKVHGVAVDQMIKKAGSFRDSLQEGWLTSKIMTETLAKFTGDLSAQQLKSLGYSEKQIKAIQKQAQAAVDAATKVKTVSQLFDVMKDSIATAWAHVFEALLGNLPQATKLLTGVAAGLSKVFVAPVQHLGELLGAWNKLGGRAYLIEGLTRAMSLFGQLLKPIGQAFRDVFPPMTAQRLVDMTKSFRDFIMNLHISEGVISGIRSLFQGLFSAVKIVWDVFKGVVTVIGKVISAATGLGGGLLAAGGGFGKIIDGARRWLEEGGRLQHFFENLGDILAMPVKLLSGLGSVLGALAQGASRALQALQPFFDKVAEGFSKLGEGIMNAIRSGDVSSILSVLNQGIFAAILLAVKKFIGNFGDAFGGGFGLMDKIKGIFSTLEGALKSLQANLNSRTLMNIAIALALLTAAVIGLSLINPVRLATALGGLTAMFSEMLGALLLLTKITAGIGLLGINATAFALILVAGAMVILAAAVAILAHLDWSQLVKGLVGVAGAMVILVGAVKILGKDAPSLIGTAIGMVILAAAMNLMATAMKILGSMDWNGIAKGLVSIAVLLTLLAVFNRYGGPALIGTAVAMIAIGVALNIIAAAMAKMGSMDMAEIGKSMLVLAGALLIIAGGMALMTEGIAGAAALLVMSVALVILANALNSLGGMSWGEIARSLVELAGALLILAAAMALMTGGIAGAAALLVMAAALTVLTPVLMALAGLSWGELLMSLVALAAIFVVLGAAGLLLAPLAPAIVALGAALVVLGAGIALIGAGVFLLGLGLTAIGVAVMTAGAAIIQFVQGLLGLIPQMMRQVGAGLVAFAGVLAQSGKAIFNAFATILTSLLNAVIKVMPLIGKAMDAIVNTMVNAISRNAPRVIAALATLLLSLLTTIANRMPAFVQKGADIIVSFLNGVARNMGRMVQAGVSVVVSFINGVSANLGRIIAAGVNMVISFVNGVANSIRSHEGEMRAAGANLGSAIVSGLISGISGMIGGAVSAAASAGHAVLSALGKAIKFFSPSHETYLIGIGFMQGFINAILDYTPRAETEAARTGYKALTALNAALLATPELSAIEVTITPVIDLTEARRGFDDLAAMAAGQMSPSVSTGAASEIASTSGTAEGGMIAVGGTNIVFNQTNTSPKALSAAEIYRQTRNQISTMKGALPA